MRTIFSCRVLAALWMVSLLTVVALSLAPGLGPPSRFGFDKVVHFAAYGWLALLGGLAVAAPRQWRLSWPLFSWPLWPLLVAGLLGMAVLSEAAQGLIDSRQARLGDAAANLLGVLSGLWLARRVPRIENRLRRALRRLPWRRPFLRRSSPPCPRPPRP